ncbi:uncharacterized protein N7515_000407 [Penicillium bovifimosum]|uniref:Uncharacterized protein n=1 Tax=Penicillium bovifimosum TaxID=126998 RepID=A0A9W9HFN6_9EURO|nr:uncharacterized protein N7515_000407 [Penicillium bovifimosum]KAJ5145843.1 hypothetical protein N7515_000407 [Penicillium bovifimosum]
MGFISTLTRRIQNKHFTRRLSTTSTKLRDEDGNDLIKTLSETSATRRISIETTSTLHAQDHPATPSISNRHTQRTDDVDTRTLFDGYGAGGVPGPIPIQTGIPPVRRAPVLKLDMCHCSFQTPVLQGREGSRDHKDGEMSASGCSCGSPVKEPGTTVLAGEEGVGGEVKQERNRRRSVADLFKRHCGLNIPRSSISLKKSGQVSPKWLDSGEGEGLVGLGGNGEEGRLNLGEKRRSVWGGGGFGRVR